MQATSPTPLETAPAPLELRSRVGLSLFWRTFFFLALLLIGSIVAWLQTFRALEFEPRAVQSAQQLASLVNLSRAALKYSDSITRVWLIKTLAEQNAQLVQRIELARVRFLILTGAVTVIFIATAAALAWAFYR